MTDTVEPHEAEGTRNAHDEVAARHVYICDRCGCKMFEANCKVICPNCGSRYDCSDLTIHLDDGAPAGVEG